MLAQATREAADWWARPRGGHAQDWIANYQRSLTTRHRTAISQIVGELQPRTLLEVGCHCGPNLIRLATDHPGLKLLGIDANAEAVTAGQQWVARSGFVDRVELRVARFPDETVALPSDCADVVLSCYAAGAYTAPADLHVALYELGRLARHAVILAEPHGAGETRHTLNGYQEWHHNYQDAIKWAATLRGRSVRVVPVDPPVDALRAILVLAR
jgi:predicted O-methyltransferase YrrM